jgi:hypothetical protein
MVPSQLPIARKVKSRSMLWFAARPDSVRVVGVSGFPVEESCQTRAPSITLSPLTAGEKTTPLAPVISAGAPELKSVKKMLLALAEPAARSAERRIACTLYIHSRFVWFYAGYAVRTRTGRTISDALRYQ